MIEREKPASFLKHARDVASFYGFLPVREVEKKVSGLPRVRGYHSFDSAAEVGAAYSHAWPEQAGLLFYATPMPKHLPFGVEGREAGEFGLVASGARESVGEAVLLKTLIAILTEW